MAKLLKLQGILSGPDREGRWNWRPIDGSSPNVPVDRDHAEPGWRIGQTVEMKVKRTPIGLKVLGAVPASRPCGRVDGPSPVLINGRPLAEVVAIEDRGPRPGLVMEAWVRYSSRDPHRPRLHGKQRPVVIIAVNLDYVVARAVYSRNTEGRGFRLRDYADAGLDRYSVVASDETLIPLPDLCRQRGDYKCHGMLSRHDWSRLHIL